jgi:hypothetical protein
MKTLIALALAAAFAASGAETRAAEAPPYYQRIDQFFSLLQAGKSKEAVEFIYGDTPWMSKSSDAVQQVLNQMASLNTLVGQFKNHDLLQEKVVAGRFAYLSYLASYDRQPIRFTFEFYRPENTWMIFSFAFDDNLDDDVETAAKQEILSR